MTGTLPRYGLAPPSEDDGLTMLARVIGVDRAAAAWARARREAGLGPAGRTGLGPAELLRVAEVLVRSEGAERAIGTSLAVRARTWLLLNREPAGGAR
ncbi:MAG TPA: hypothetical protein VM890_14740 [Longimicrobium sp.]|jgi:hypothetical protein|nr:hypothetical protein [Longimicrobium sp.]